MGCFESRERPLQEVGPVSQRTSLVEAPLQPLPNQVDGEEVLSIVLANRDVRSLRDRPLTYAAERGVSWVWSRIREGNWTVLVFKLLRDSAHALARVVDRRTRISLSNGLGRDRTERGRRRVNQEHRDIRLGANNAWAHYTRVRRDFLLQGFEASRNPLVVVLRPLSRRLSRE